VLETAERQLRLQFEKLVPDGKPGPVQRPVIVVARLDVSDCGPPERLSQGNEFFLVGNLSRPVDESLETPSYLWEMCSCAVQSVFFHAGPAVTCPGENNDEDD